MCVVCLPFCLHFLYRFVYHSGYLITFWNLAAPLASLAEECPAGSGDPLLRSERGVASCYRTLTWTLSDARHLPCGKDGCNALVVTWLRDTCLTTGVCFKERPRVNGPVNPEHESTVGPRWVPLRYWRERQTGPLLRCKHRRRSDSAGFRRPLRFRALSLPLMCPVMSWGSWAGRPGTPSASRNA